MDIETTKITIQNFNNVPMTPDEGGKTLLQECIILSLELFREVVRRCVEDSEIIETADMRP